MRKMLNRKTGITLVALVVTIIVLIILAGVSITLVLGNNGIVTRAKLARENTDKAQEIESNILASYEYEMEHIASTRDSIEETLLFPSVEDGSSAYEVETEYNLNTSYKNYKYLLVEGELLGAPGSVAATSTMLVPTKNIVNVDTVVADGTTSHSCWSMFVACNWMIFYFNSDTTFKLQSVSGNGIRISHIYGIK